MSTSNRENNFNFIRLTLAILVLLAHSFELLDGNKNREILFSIFGVISFGDLAVNGFFLVSGYLITKSWTQNPETSSFLKKRILRIYPGFIAASLMCIIVAAPIGSQPNIYPENIDPITTIRNLILLKEPHASNIFSNQPYPVLNGSMWTINYEFKCYILTLVFGITGAIRKKFLWLLSSIILGIIQIHAEISIESLKHITNFRFENHIFRLSFFYFAGGCFYLYQEKIIQNFFIAIASVAVVLISLNNNYLVNISIAVFGGYSIFYFAASNIKPINIFKKLPDTSYGLYLYGWPVQKIIIDSAPGISPQELFSLSLLLSILLGLLSWNLIEKHFTSRNQKSPTISTSN